MSDSQIHTPTYEAEVDAAGLAIARLLDEYAVATEPMTTSHRMAEAALDAAEVVRREAFPPSPTALVLLEVERERAAQDRKFGEQNHPNGTGELLTISGARMDQLAYIVRDMVERARAEGREIHWSLIAFEEVFEAMAETDPVKLRAELVQCSATFAAWIESIDRGRQSVDGWTRGAMVDADTASRIPRRTIEQRLPLHRGRPIRDDPQA